LIKHALCLKRCRWLYGIRFFSDAQTMAADILSPPVLTDGFRRIVQPPTICKQSNQFDGAEKFNRIGPRSAQRL
jgi:hypothetical protein